MILQVLDSAELGTNSFETQSVEELGNEKLTTDFGKTS